MCTKNKKEEEREFSYEMEHDKVDKVKDDRFSLSQNIMLTIVVVYGCLRRFIKDLVKIIEPLGKLFRVCQTDISKIPYLRTDAFNYAVGAVWDQEPEEYGMKIRKQISITLKLLNNAQLRYPGYEKEAFTVYWMEQKSTHYLHYKEFFLYTDHQNLVQSFVQNK